METKNKLGKNIQALRSTFGESQEELGMILGIEKTAISNYEKGIRKPKREVLEEIAKHYMISVEELLNEDFDGTKKVKINIEYFYKNIKSMFPIVSTEDAMKNEHFKAAYIKHELIFKKLNNMDTDVFDYIDACKEEYRKAMKCSETAIMPDIAADLLSVMTLEEFLLGPALIAAKRRPALLTKMMENDYNLSAALFDLDLLFEGSEREIEEEIKDVALIDEFINLKRILKNSWQCEDIGDYFIALHYIFNIVDNNLSWDFNRRVGYEMMVTFARMGNAYAGRFNDFYLKNLGLDSE